MNFLKKMFGGLDQRGVIHLIPLFLILAGIIAGVYLVQHPQIFKPKAVGENINFEAADGKDSNGKDCRIYTDSADKKLKTTCPSVNIKFTSPLETQESSDAGSNMSLVKEAYAAEPGEGNYCKRNVDITKIYHIECKSYGLHWCFWPFYDLNKEEVEYTCEDGRECVDTTGLSVGSPQSAICKPSSPSEKPVESAAGAGANPINIRPEGKVPLEPRVIAIPFVWSGPDRADVKYYRLVVDSPSTTKPSALNNCSGEYSNYLICANNLSRRSISQWGYDLEGGYILYTGDGDGSIAIDPLQDGITYTWWVDALDENGNVIGTSNPTEFTVQKQTADGEGGDTGTQTGGGDEAAGDQATGDKVNPPVCESITVSWGDNIRRLLNNEEIVEVPLETLLRFTGKIRNDDGDRDSIDWQWNTEPPFKVSGWDNFTRSSSQDVRISIGYTDKLSMKIYGVSQPACVGNIKFVAKQTAASGGGDEAAGDQAPSAGRPGDAGGSATIECQTNPLVEGPEGYKWEADCNNPCSDTQNHSDCPQSEDPYVRRETSNWCYAFKEGNRCMVLKYEGTTSGGASDASGVGDTSPQQAAERVTVEFKFSEDESDFLNKDAGWQKYPPAAPVPYTFKDTKPGPKFIYAQFKDNQDNIINANPYPVQIELVAEEAAVTPTPTPTSTPRPTPRPTPTPPAVHCGITDISQWQNCTIPQLKATFTNAELARLPVPALEKFSNSDLLAIANASGDRVGLLSQLTGARLIQFSLSVINELPCSRIASLPGYIQDQITKCQ